MPEPSSSSTDASPVAPGGRARSSDTVILVTVCLAQFMVVLDISIVNVALPAIQRGLHFRAVDLQWVVTAYALTFGGLLLLGGRLADLFGRRRIFLVGLGLFTAASLLGGFAADQTTLIAARSLQGVGAAILSPATLTILTVTFTDQRARAKAFGVWSAVAAGGGAAGALFGGILTQYLSWRWILFVNVPIGIALFAVARLRLHESRADGPRRRLDVAGAATITGALFLLVYAISHTDVVSWTATSTLVVLAAAVLLLVAFVAVEARAASHPLVPLRIFRVRSVTGANLVMFCFGVGMFAMWFFLSLYLQQVLGYSPVVTGFTFLPQTLAIAVGATLSGRLAPRLGPRNVLMIGAVLGSAGLFWLSFIQAGDNYWSGACGGGILATFGMGLAFTPIALLATGGVPHEDAGLASGLVNCSRQIGASVGLAALTTVAASRTASVLLHGPHAGHPAVPSGALDVAMTAGYARGFLIASVVVLAGGLLGFVIPPPRTQGAGRAGTTADQVPVAVD
ncbi:MAG TPA: MFS transporter [Acidimicrobiales bacterium]|nr:MFS transporter [Acidimicrobiales bacterium]